MNQFYFCIDLKTFFASVECAMRGLDPFKTNLVVADPSRGQGALCLAITPQMKAMGIRNRCRLFEIPKSVQYIIAVPRMKLYMTYSAYIYQIYLQYVAPKDIHVYSIDECFIDATTYLNYYHLRPIQFAKMLMDAVFQKTGITATAGIGTNLYLAKVALDILAKHAPDNIGTLSEKRYQKQLWHHQPLTDFWHIGKGIERRLQRLGIRDMQDLAFYRQDVLYQEFGINAQYLIDHAWGREETTLAEIKNYRPKSHSISNSQVLFEDYTYDQALLVLKEMVDLNVLKLVEKQVVTDEISLYIGYSKNVIRGTGGQRKLTVRTNSAKILMAEFIDLYRQHTRPDHSIRQIGISFNHIMDEYYESYDLFSDLQALDEEKRLQCALIDIKHKFGKNAVLKGMNKLDKATTEKRNTLIGGHNAQ